MMRLSFVGQGTLCAHWLPMFGSLAAFTTPWTSPISDKALHTSRSLSSYRSPGSESSWLTNGACYRAPIVRRVGSHRHCRIFNFLGMNASGSYPHSKIALLLSDNDDYSATRGDHIRQVLSSSGFDLRTFSNIEDGLMDLPKASDAADATVVVFDLTGRGGQSLSQASEEAQVEGLYVFKSATGMFRKVFGRQELPAWIDPLVGSSYEQVLESGGWGFLSEDPSEPRFAFDLVETTPWERARDERTRDPDEAPKVSPLGYAIERMSDAQVDATASGLTAKQVRVLLEGDTDAPDESPQLTSAPAASRGSSKQEGVFVCAVGGLPLFLSEDMIPPLDGARRGGWPGFRRPVHPEHVLLREEPGPLRRMEVLCARSGCHLGHVFDDGPPPTGQRFCINRSSLVLVPITEPLAAELRPIHRPTDASIEECGSLGMALQRIEMEASTFAGGCFWHVQDDFLAVPGVHEATCGHVGGVEAVRVLHDPLVAPYERLVRRFFDMHDPTTGDRQGNDWGPRYQAAMFPHGDSQQRAAEKVIAWAEMQLRGKLGSKESQDGTPFSAAETEDVSGEPKVDVGPSQAKSGSVGNEIPRSKKDGLCEGDLSIETPLSVAWWELQEIRTRIIPAAVDDFVPDADGDGHSKI